MEYTGIEFDCVRTWIRKKRENIKKQATWEDLLFACKENDASLANFLESRTDEDDWPKMSIDDWKAIVAEQKKAEEETVRFAYETGAAIIHGDYQNNIVQVSENKASSWQTYKMGLQNKGFKEDDINEIERATLSILRRLSLDTTQTGPIKGMVVGNVQSGKTANMAALMAMAADCGWNMFVVLSGSIEALRGQTEERLFDDLHKDNCQINWQPLDHPSSRSPRINKANAMYFNDRNHAYFTVCLKNKARLKELIRWMQEDGNAQAQMKVMVIDDEADQAGINTADITTDERKAINRLIENLVNGKKWDDADCESHYQTMNYIGYTATPYANILNDSRASSLYPKDFIATLSTSNTYFGPQQVFGCEDSGYEGLDVVRIVPNDEVSSFDHVHKNDDAPLPQSMKDSICWFLCGVACMRHWGYTKPISMLVHTSQKTDFHAKVAKKIENWIKNHPVSDFVEKCRSIWEKEIVEFSMQKFLDQYPDYGAPIDEIRDYPIFEDIKHELENLLGGPTRISSIPMADQRIPHYHSGIHLCVDNCKNNGIENDMMLRLMYPSKKSMPSPAPAFIVVGGATLSRGLTIEGLISTYFLRSVKQSDTLMQMGRWFGFRRGYELIPRIWISQNTKTQFEFLSLLDQRLRDEIHYMDSFGIKPSQYGPRVTNSPRMSFIRIVAKNRMQSAQDTDKDFSGASSQTQLFDNNQDVIQSNIDCTREFLQGLGAPETTKECNAHAKNCMIWRNVPFNVICEYIRKYSFQERQSVFQKIDEMLDWIQQMTDEDAIGDWNVVLAGIGGEDHKNYWEVCPGVGVHKVIRSQKTKNMIDGVLDIGALRVPKDIIADIDLDDVNDDLVKDRVKHFASKYALELREKAGLSKIPQLLVYIIDKNSEPTKPNADRCPLNALDDLVGLSLTIPGEKKYANNTATVSIIIDDLGVNDVPVDIQDEN